MTVEKWNVTAEELEIFVAEAEEMLQQMTENLLKLEHGTNEHDPRLMQNIFRAAHTIKGGAATIGYEQMTHLSHQMEDLFDLMRSGQLQPDKELINILLEGVDNLSIMLLDMSFPGNALVPDLTQLNNHLNGYLKGANEPIIEYEEIPPLPPPAQDIYEADLEQGAALYNIALKLHDHATLPAVRFLQIYFALSSHGTILESDPSQEQIEREEVGREMRLWLSSNSSQVEIEMILQDSDDVAHYEVAPFATPATGQAGAAKTSDNNRSDLGMGQVETVGDSDIDQLSAQSRRATNIRVDVERLDRIMNLVGELVVERTNLARIAMLFDLESGESPLVVQLRQAVNQLNIIGNELQHEVLKTRMVPLERVFKRFPRTVRDLAQKLDKQVEFIVEGAETELDRLIIEEISDPLLHIIRNALDHGIESPQRRQLVDKNPLARMSLRARYQDGAVFIEVEDDGRGISADTNRQRAVERGILSQTEAARMSDDEAVHLIFKPGFSTATTVTDVSGRGVGLDIVQTNIERLGGSVSVYTHPGYGSRFTLRLPLTLAIIKALLVRAGKQDFALPLGAVSQIMRLERSLIQTVEGLPVIRLQNDFIPLIRLDKALGIGQNSSNLYANGNSNHANNHSNNHHDLLLLAVVRFGQWQAGLIVDRFLGEQEVVVKPLGSFVGEIQGIAGAMIQSDGRVALIIDIPSLLQSLVNSNRATVRATLM